MKLYPEDTLERFEFDKLLGILSENCRSPIGRSLAEKLSPIEDFHQMLLQLEQTREYLNVSEGKVHFPAFSFQDVQKEISILKIANSCLNEKQMVQIRDLSDICNQIIKYLSDKKEVFPAIIQIFRETYFTDEIVNAVDQVIDPAGIVRSNASKALAEIRKNLQLARRELDRVFRHHLSKYRKLGWLADIEESVYNGRRVLSVVAEQKRSVKGIVQGASDTGKTTFIEPIETVDLSNDVFELEIQEKREIQRILKALTAKLQAYLPLIVAYQQALGFMDFTRAKAYLAKSMNAQLPFVIRRSELNLINARHPLLILQLQTQGKNVVPFSCTFKPDQRIMVVSGPNAGGKSITLKTIGLLQLMLQCGMLVPVDERSEMGVFNQLFCDIGDSQSIEYELSTYSSRLKKMKHILDFAEKKTLVLIDEFGTGTDPELGGAMAEAMLEEMVQKRCYGVITTHYSNLKIAADRLQGTFNACMLFDDHTLSPRYELNIGQPGSSYTFVIARKSGLSKQLIQSAESKTDKDKVKLDRLLKQLHQLQQKAKTELTNSQEQQKLSLEKQAKYDELYEKWQLKLQHQRDNKEQTQKLAEAGRKYLKLIAEWDQAKDKQAFYKLLSKQFQTEKKKKLEKKNEVKAEKRKAQKIAQNMEQIKVGSRVKLLSGKQVGVVEEIVQKKAKVLFGNLITTAGLESLELVE